MADSFFLSLLVSLAFNLVFTLIIEVGMAMVMGVWEHEDIKTVVKVNCITNPIVVILMNLSYELSQSITVRNLVTAVLEIVVVWVETVMYRRWLVHRKRKTFLLSLVLNASSFGIGVVFCIILSTWGEI